MAVRTKAGLATQIETLLADNSNGGISAGDLRSLLTDMLDSAAWALDPLLASAPLYIDAARNGPANEGTAGSVLNGLGPAVDPATEKAALYGANELQASTCPDAAALDLTTGFVVWVDLASVWVKPDPSSIVAKPRDGGTVIGETEDCYAVGVGEDGIPYIEWYDGAHFARTFDTTNPDDAATVTVQFAADDGRKQLGFEFIGNNGSGGWTARLHAGTPSSHTLLSEIVNTTDGAQTIETSSEALRVGDFAYGAMYRARLYGTLGGTLLRDFYPDRDHVSGATMTSDTGETWSNVLIPTTPAFGYLVVPDDPALDVAADADATFAFWLTTPYLADVDGEQYLYASRATGTLGANGNGFNLTDWLFTGFGIDFTGSVLGDGTDQAMCVVSTQHWDAGSHHAVLTIDRGTDVATLYVDGVEFATVDITAVGAMNPAADLILSSAAHHAVAKWDEVLDPATIAAARP